MNFLDLDDSTTTLSVTKISCGNHEAATCAECPQGHGAGWCNGVCTWQDSKCVPSGKHVVRIRTLGYTIVPQNFAIHLPLITIHL